MRSYTAKQLWRKDLKKALQKEYPNCKVYARNAGHFGTTAIGLIDKTTGEDLFKRPEVRAKVKQIGDAIPQMADLSNFLRDSNDEQD